LAIDLPGFTQVRREGVVMPHPLFFGLRFLRIPATASNARQ
jgi:hypothetical protein